MHERLISESRAPERVRNAFEKVLAAGAPAPALDDETLARFVRVAEVSRFAVDVLRSTPDAWAILSNLSYAPPAVDDTDREAKTLRGDLARTLLWVVILDVLELVPFTATLRELSDLADRCAARALATAWAELERDFGSPERVGSSEASPGVTDNVGLADYGGLADCVGFAILGMGKLGGRELNFSSDVDLIFLYRDDGETSGGRRSRIENAIFYTRLATRVVELLSSRALSPHAFRVDMRLRPEGASGPLVRSLDSTLRYYEREGSSWERQALLKARCIAGDAGLGKDFLERISPFIYRRYLDRDTIQQIENIKARIEAQAAEHGRRHVKLSFGGIREIEFIVQIMQLADGGRCEAVRTPSTMEALERLRENRYLSETESTELGRQYLFLRRLENRLQMLDCRQTHLLPERKEEMDLLAFGLGFHDGEDLWRRYLEMTAAVRKLYEGRFRLSREISVTAIEEKVIDILDEGRDSDAQAESLASLGLKEESMFELRKLARGSFADPPTSSVRRLFIRSTAVWLPMLLSLPDPDSALKRMSRMVEGYGTKAMLYEIFSAHHMVAKLVVNIASLSQPLTGLIVSDPSALEALLSPGGVTGQRGMSELKLRLAELTEGISDDRQAKETLRTEESLRIGVRFLLGLADAHEAGVQFSDLAELLLGEPEFGVLALGRFGRRNLGPASDLDLVFVTDGDTESATALVKERMAFWNKLGLKIDARLRPMGRTSPLVTHVDSLRKYFRETAETWERLVWSQARTIAAGPGLSDRLEEIISEFLFERPLGKSEMSEIRAMRARLLPKQFGDGSPSNALRELKRGPGGLIDIDFIAAIRRIERKSREPDPSILLADSDELVGTYNYLHALEKAIYFALGREISDDDAESSIAGVRTILARHGLDLDDAAEKRRRLGAHFLS